MAVGQIDLKKKKTPKASLVVSHHLNQIKKITEDKRKENELDY